MEYKKFKGLKKEGLRDNMTNLESVLNMLAEVTTTEISKEKKPKTFFQSKIIAKDSSGIAGKARKDIENKIGKSIISSKKVKYLKNKKKKKIK